MLRGLIGGSQCAAQELVSAFSCLSVRLAGWRHAQLDGWMDGWMDGWVVNGWMEGWNRSISRRLYLPSPRPLVRGCGPGPWQA